MEIDPKIMDQVMGILEEEVVPAQGCTEPIAVAYVAAKARQILGQVPDRLRVYVSGNIIKNVKSVIVPNSGGLAGTEVAGAMGALAGDPEKELQVLTGVTSEAMEEVKAFLAQDRVEVVLEKTPLKLYIKVEAFAKDQTAFVEVKHTHTNITQVARNGRILVNRPCKDADFNSPLQDREILSIGLIYDLARHLDLDRIRPLFRKVRTLDLGKGIFYYLIVKFYYYFSYLYNFKWLKYYSCNGKIKMAL